MRYNRLYYFLFLLSVSIGSITAQGLGTPYSRYGYGVLSDNTTSAQRAMGGIGYAMNSGRQINVMNPASYAAIDSLTFLFDMGVDLNNLWTSQGEDKGTKLGGGLDYITLQFPITKYGGGSIGFLPYSQVGYSFGDKVTNGTTAYQGSGGISQVYLGLAARPLKGLTLGINIGYLFGDIKHDDYAYTSAGSIGLFERTMEVSDYSLDIGVQYSYQINKKNRLTAGVTFSPGKSFHGHSYAINYDSSSDSEPDTIRSISMKHHYTKPFSLGIGLNWEWNDRLMIEADVTYQPWSKAKFTGLDENDRTRLVDRYKFAFGAQYCHNPRGDYASRIQYRAGFSATRDYWSIFGNSIREYGIHAGVGLPAPSSKTMINLSLGYQLRTSTPNTLIKEKYFFITLGVNFNELWFWQNKIR